MTPAEWQQSTDLDALLQALDDRAKTRPVFRRRGNLLQLLLLDGGEDGPDVRKRLLFGAACCRRLGARLSDDTRRGLEMIERLADSRLRPAEIAMDAWHTSVAPYVASHFTSANMDLAARNAARAAPDWNAERLAQCELLRDLFDPLSWDVMVDPSWVSPLVRSMAQTIYDEHHFEDLPILADALEEAGCDSAMVLDHCRSAAPHARGCWLLDTLLDKK